MAARTLFSLQLEHFSSLFILAGALQRVAPNLPLRQYRQVYSSMPPTSPTFDDTVVEGGTHAISELHYFQNRQVCA